jgi:hypothetical protein
MATLAQYQKYMKDWAGMSLTEWPDGIMNRTVMGEQQLELLIAPRAHVRSVVYVSPTLRR